MTSILIKRPIEKPSNVFDQQPSPNHSHDKDVGFDSQINVSIKVTYLFINKLKLITFNFTISTMIKILHQMNHLQ